MLYILIGALVLLAAMCMYWYSQAKNTHTLNTEIDQQNQELHKSNVLLIAKNRELNQKKTELIHNVKGYWDQLEDLQKRIDNTNKEMREVSKQTAAAIEKQKEVSGHAFSAYADTLEYAYQQADQKYDKRIQELQDQERQVRKDLEVISATRAAARAALQKEQEVKDNKDNYRLLPSALELDDIHKLEIIKKDLHKPRVLSMLIWSTFWQPLAKTKFPQIIQNKTAMGIYKITNIMTDECYIGQSVDIYKRWTDHCKCGLGIDTPPGNKLYKAIQDYGLENFTFEVVAECPREELDEKERYFIKLYEADIYGYNGNIGINKK